MRKHQCKAPRNVKEGNMTPPKVLDDFQVTNPKEMEICELPEKDLKTIILRKGSEIQENTDRQHNELRKTMQQ